MLGEKGKIIAITQPCFFPYLGYYQLINAANQFVLYDDVTFMKGKWINRNRIIVNGSQHLFTLPIEHQSSNRTILETRIDSKRYLLWKQKFIKTLQHAYKRAPYRDEVIDLVIQTLDVDNYMLSEICYLSLRNIFSYLGVDTKISRTSSVYGGCELGRIERLVHIVRSLSGDTYINSSGGRSLYDADNFSAHGIDLYFLDSELPPYNQMQPIGIPFIPALSIIDMLMFCSVGDMRLFLGSYSLCNK